jgi:hypothetical protein
MKTERRHELQHNTLDSELSKLGRFLRKHGNQIFWGAFICVAVFLVVLYARGRILNRQITARREYERLLYQEMPPQQRIQELVEYAENTHDQRRAALALIAVGDTYLNMLLAGGSDAPLMLQRAEETYSRVLRDFPDQQEVCAKAHLGLATVAVDRRDFETAKQKCCDVLAVAEVAGTPTSAEARRLLQMLPSLQTPVVLVSRPPQEPPMEVLEGMSASPEDEQEIDVEVPWP